MGKDRKLDRGSWRRKLAEEAGGGGTRTLEAGGGEPGSWRRLAGLGEGNLTLEGWLGWGWLGWPRGRGCLLVFVRRLIFCAMAGFTRGAGYGAFVPTFEVGGRSVCGWFLFVLLALQPGCTPLERPSSGTQATDTGQEVGGAAVADEKGPQGHGASAAAIKADGQGGGDGGEVAVGQQAVDRSMPESGQSASGQPGARVSEGGLPGADEPAEDGAEEGGSGAGVPEEGVSSEQGGSNADESEADEPEADEPESGEPQEGEAAESSMVSDGSGQGQGGEAGAEAVMSQPMDTGGNVPEPGEGQAGQSVESNPMEPAAPQPGLVAKTARECFAHTDRAEEQCGSYYCGVDQETLAAALDPSNPCEFGAEAMCTGQVMVLIEQCGWEAVVNSRDAVEVCIRGGINLASVEQYCMDCFVDASMCAAEACAARCLGPSEQACAICLRDSGCDPVLFECAGWPSPF